MNESPLIRLFSSGIAEVTKDENGKFKAQLADGWQEKMKQAGLCVAFPAVLERPKRKQR